uniref:t-SNARE coiled-coil homology domain-containing protein n=1 Tax=Loa loa TaxID=7209 RepID=A0A1I7VKW9_LOALO
MKQKDGLLLDSDDSDIPDLDLPTASVRKGRPKLFSKARQNAETVIVRQQSCSVQIALILLLFAVVISIAFLGYFTSYISSQLEQLRNDPRHEVVTRELEIIKCEMNRIKLDIDILRLMASSPGTPTWNTPSLLYTRLEHIESQISGIADKVQERLNNHLENDTLNMISERVNAVADACIQGCGAVSKLVVFNNGTRYTLDSTGDKLKKKRSKIPQWSFTRDTPVIFTRAKHV